MINACKTIWSPEGPLPKSVTQSICDERLAKFCEDTLSTEHRCDEQIAEYDRLNYQQMELNQDLRELQKLHFQCLSASVQDHVSRRGSSALVDNNPG
jgi:hypothetical protein